VKEGEGVPMTIGTDEVERRKLARRSFGTGGNGKAYPIIFILFIELKKKNTVDKKGLDIFYC